MQNMEKLLLKLAPVSQPSMNSPLWHWKFEFEMWFKKIYITTVITVVVGLGYGLGPTRSHHHNQCFPMVHETVSVKLNQNHIPSSGIGFTRFSIWHVSVFGWAQGWVLPKQRHILFIYLFIIHPSIHSFIIYYLFIYLSIYLFIIVMVISANIELCVDELQHFNPRSYDICDWAWSNMIVALSMLSSR